MAKKKRLTHRLKTVSPIQTKTPALSAPANIWRRIGALVVDYLIIGIPNALIVWYMKDIGVYTGIAGYYTIFLVLVVFGYFILFTFINEGQTFGKMLLRTRVVGKDRPLTLLMIVVRYGFLFVLIEFPSIVHFLFGVTLGIGYLVVNLLAILLVFVLLIIQSQHRGVHDFLAGTWVIRK